MLALTSGGKALFDSALKGAGTKQAILDSRKAA